MNNLSRTITGSTVRGLKLSDTIATASTIAAAVNSLDNRLSDLSIDMNNDDIGQLMDLLKTVITRFGGVEVSADIDPLLSGELYTIVSVMFDQDDIDNGYNAVTLLQDPMLESTYYGIYQVSWGDDNTSFYAPGVTEGYTSHTYETSGSYQLKIQGYVPAHSIFNLNETQNIPDADIEPKNAVKSVTYSKSGFQDSDVYWFNQISSEWNETQQEDVECRAMLSGYAFDPHTQVAEPTYTSIFIPKTEDYIFQECFKTAVAARELYIPDDSCLSAIGPSAFMYAGNLRYLWLPDGLKSIGDYAFAECSELETIRLPESLETIGVSAFASVKDSCHVEWPDANSSKSSVSYIR